MHKALQPNNGRDWAGVRFQFYAVFYATRRSLPRCVRLRKCW